MNKKQLVFNRLKPKAKSLGFNEKELKGIAAKIADNLTSTDEATEEELVTEIEEKIDAIIPFLSFGQSQANRLLDEWKKKKIETDDDDNDGVQIYTGKQNQTGSKVNPKITDDDETPNWAKSLSVSIETLKGEIATLKGEKIVNSRKSKLESLLKDTGTFGFRTLKNFSKMNFKDDEEFEEFYSEIEEDLKSYNQERANNELSSLGNPPAGNQGGKKKEEPFSDKEIDAMAEL